MSPGKAAPHSHGRRLGRRAPTLVGAVSAAGPTLPQTDAGPDTQQGEEWARAAPREPAWGGGDQGRGTLP